MSENKPKSVNLVEKAERFLERDEKKPKSIADLDKKIQEFPTTAPYKIDPFEFADSYITKIKKWHGELLEDLKQLQEYWIGELHKLEKAKELASKENAVVPYMDGCISLLREVFGVKKGEDNSASHRLLRTCCPDQYDRNEESSIYTIKKSEHGDMMKEFHRHDKWLKFASKCKEGWQEFEGIPSPLPSCKITKSVCDYESCPRNIWKKGLKK